MAKRKRTASSSGASASAHEASSSERAFLLAEIERLNSAIDELKGRKADGIGAPSAVEINGALRHLLVASDRKSRDDQEIVHHGTSADDGLSQQLHALANLTGIIFTEATSSLHTAGAQTLRTFSLTGSCFDLSFDLTFDVDEADTKICALDVTVPASALVELKLFIDSVKDSLSPQAFFRGFVQYAEWNKQRTKLFKDLRESNPELVKLPLGSTCSWLLHVDGPTDRGFAFNIAWRLVVNSDGQIRCDLQFMPRFKARGNSAVSKTAGFARRFAALLRLKGIEEALHILVDLVTAARA